MPLTPIKTYWNGIIFRSRLEARWAVFYDWIGVKYCYEQEGYELAEGTRYLPDFWLPDYDCWIEVKPASPTQEERAKAELLVIDGQHPLHFVFPPATIDSQDWPNRHLSFWPYPPNSKTIDITDDAVWHPCRRCGRPLLIRPLDFAQCPGEWCDFDLPWGIDRIETGYYKARAMQFENRPYEFESFTEPTTGRLYARRIKDAILEEVSSDAHRQARGGDNQKGNLD